MARWIKLLARMVADRRPRSYSYDEAASILSHLGFVLATPTDGSHRKWRRSPQAGSPAIIIGLVDPPRGNLPPEYVKDMVRTLIANDLLPVGVEKP